MLCGRAFASHRSLPGQEDERRSGGAAVVQERVREHGPGGVAGEQRSAIATGEVRCRQPLVSQGHRRPLIPFLQTASLSRIPRRMMRHEPASA